MYIDDVVSSLARIHNTFSSQDEGEIQAQRIGSVFMYSPTAPNLSRIDSLKKAIAPPNFVDEKIYNQENLPLCVIYEVPQGFDDADFKKAFSSLYSDSRQILGVLDITMGDRTKASAINLLLEATSSDLQWIVITEDTSMKSGEGRRCFAFGLYEADNCRFVRLCGQYDKIGEPAHTVGRLLDNYLQERGTLE